MGSRNRSLITEPSLFFVTTAFRDWNPLFGDSEIRDDFESLLFSLFPSHADALMGYVIMPNHIHLLVGCVNGGFQLSKFMQTLKSLSARRLFNKKGSVWNRRFDDLVMLSDEQFCIKLNYIHENPMRKGLVSDPGDWKWSSSQFWSSEEPHPVLVKTWDWTEE